MLNMVSIELSPQQIEDAVERLPLRAKLRIFNKLGKETRKERWREIIKDIDERLKKFPVSQDEIGNEIKAYRQEKYAKSRH